MDIMQGPLETRVSPPPAEARFMQVDTGNMIRKAIEQHPEMTPDEITALLNNEGIAVSGVWVARIAQIMTTKESKA